MKLKAKKEDRQKTEVLIAVQGIERTKNTECDIKIKELTFGQTNKV
jgi:hypothetical protein